jgi:nuclear pore complex protein Nup85
VSFGLEVKRSFFVNEIVTFSFWSRLLADTIPLLEYKEPIIPSKETFVILYHLESNWLPLLKKKKDMKSDDSSLISMLRLACARNLSRAFVIEKSLAL